MNEQFLCLSAADVHGNKLQYETIKQQVIERQISFVFLCGDILPKTGGTWTPENKVRTIAMQATFIQEYFIDYLTELGKLTNVYTIFGNDDFKSNYNMLAQADIPNVHFLDNEVVKLPVPNQDLYVAGYPYIGMTPFLHKDWEKWDTKAGVISHKIYRTDGYSSQDSQHIPVDFTKDNDRQSTIAQDLDQLARLSDPKKTVYIFHEAPFSTPLDTIARDNKYIKDNQLHIGSKAIRTFIEQESPLITMHGHIHETSDESGDYKWRSGSSVSVTAANDFMSDDISYVLFSLPSPATTTQRVG